MQTYPGIMKLHIGTTHDRPELLPLNTRLKEIGSEWRVTTAKSVGLHIWNPKTGVCRLPDDNGDVIIPDIPQMKLGDKNYDCEESKTRKCPHFNTCLPTP